jgi:hypothetical protein
MGGTSRTSTFGLFRRVLETVNRLVKFALV